MFEQESLSFFIQQALQEMTRFKTIIYNLLIYYRHSFQRLAQNHTVCTYICIFTHIYRETGYKYIYSIRSIYIEFTFTFTDMQIASSRTRRHPLPGARDATRPNWQRISSDFIAIAGIVSYGLVAAMIYPLLVETALCAGKFPMTTAHQSPTQINRSECLHSVSQLAIFFALLHVSALSCEPA